MAVAAIRCQEKGMDRKDKEARLAAALRENLRKRKAAAQGAKSVTDEAGTPGDQERNE
jgi:hypothetical protein